MKVGRRRITDLGILEVDDRDAELDLDVVVSKVLLRSGYRLDGNQDGDGALGGDSDLLAVADTASNGAGQLVNVRLLLDGEVGLERLAGEDLGLLQLEADVRAGPDVLVGRGRGGAGSQGEIAIRRGGGTQDM